MSGFDYVRIDSWHIIKLTTRGGGKQTLCGRYLPSPSVADLSRRLPLGEKSCESCLRLSTNQGDEGAGAEESPADTAESEPTAEDIEWMNAPMGPKEE